MNFNNWLVWLLGGEWEEIDGWESTAAHPDFPACASQAGFVLKGREGAIATVSLDYLRPESASTHGDERVRIAGTEGVLELGPAVPQNQLLRRDRPGESLPLPEPDDWYVRFVRSLRGQGSSPIPRAEAFRATEIACGYKQVLIDAAILGDDEPDAVLVVQPPDDFAIGALQDFDEPPANLRLGD